MTRYDHFLRLLILIGFVIAGVMATAAVSGIVLLASGLSLKEIADMSADGMEHVSAGITRGLLIIQHLCIFIIPSLLFGLVVYRKKLWSAFDLDSMPTFTLIILGIFFLLAAYPLVNLSFLLNESIELPLWTRRFENQAEDTLRLILQMDTFAVFLINLLLISILPGIGEELLFRGLIQKHLAGWMNNPIAAIWITAILFSSIHMQFEGFFPRLVLGALLGYLYYWTNNLWVPIITHAFNNGIQVVMIYALDVDLNTFEEEGSAQLDWWMIPLSVATMFFIYRLITKKE